MSNAGTGRTAVEWSVLITAEIHVEDMIYEPLIIADLAAKERECEGLRDNLFDCSQDLGSLSHVTADLRSQLAAMTVDRDRWQAFADKQATTLVEYMAEKEKAKDQLATKEEECKEKHDLIVELNHVDMERLAAMTEHMEKAERVSEGWHVDCDRYHNLFSAAEDRIVALVEQRHNLAEMLRNEHKSRNMAMGGHKFRDRCPTCAAIDASLAGDGAKVGSDD